MCGQRIFRPNKSVDASLRLSSKAQSRIFAPAGVLNDHHAVQFVTFSPPLDPNRLPLDILSEPRTETGSHSSASFLHDSIDDFDPFPKLKVKRTNGTDNSTLSPPQQRPSSNRTLSNRGFQGLPSLEPTAEHQPRRSILSKLNCCRNKDDGNRNNNNNTSSVMSPVLTLTEEQQRRWSTFDITGPIAEDIDFQSVAAFSVSQSSTVSMSAPLLMSPKSSYRRVGDNHRGSPAKRWVTKADF
jgi:hypothetical protein